VSSTAIVVHTDAWRGCIAFTAFARRSLSASRARAIVRLAGPAATVSMTANRSSRLGGSAPRRVGCSASASISVPIAGLSAGWICVMPGTWRVSAHHVCWCCVALSAP